MDNLKLEEAYTQMRSYFDEEVGYDIFLEDINNINDYKIDIFCKAFILRLLEESITGENDVEVVFLNKPITKSIQDQHKE